MLPKGAREEVIILAPAPNNINPIKDFIEPAAISLAGFFSNISPTIVNKATSIEA